MAVILGKYAENKQATINEAQSRHGRFRVFNRQIRGLRG